MIDKFVEAWDANKKLLEEHFKTHRQEEYSSYKALVKLLFEIVINPCMENCYADQFLTDEILCIDDGNYQGTLIFILHKDCYQPGTNDYVFTSVYYGSCSGCDTLQSIHQYDDELPSTVQVKEYMDLCLHLLQRCKTMAE